MKALGKQSEIAALMKTLGGMSPDERQRQAPLIHGLRDAVADAIAARKAALEAAALDARLAVRDGRHDAARRRRRRRARSTRSAR